MVHLENAVQNGAQNAEMRHRTNIAAEGTWFLLGNIIAIASILGMCQKDDKKIFKFLGKCIIIFYFCKLHNTGSCNFGSSSKNRKCLLPKLL
jgi:hypothetical protein